MLVNLAAPVSEASGALGSSVVFYRWRTSQCLRDYVIPSNPATVNQVTVRGTLSSLTKGWAALSDANRATWDAYAAANLITDRLGRQVKSTALGWYVACNSMLSYVGASLIDDAPIYPAPQPCVGFAAVKNDSGTGTVVTSVQYNGTAPAGAYWLARKENLPTLACKPVLRRQIMIGGPDGASFTTVASSGSNAEWTSAVPGAVGAAVGFTIQMLDVRTGLVSVPFTKAVTVVSV